MADLTALPAAVQTWIAEQGSPATALLEISRALGVAVHYQDRGTIEASLNRPLSDYEWQTLRPHLDGYDEWLENSGARDSIDTWRDEILADAGIHRDCDSCGEPIFTADDGQVHHMGETDPYANPLPIDALADAEHRPSEWSIEANQASARADRLQVA